MLSLTLRLENLGRSTDNGERFYRKSIARNAFGKKGNLKRRLLEFNSNRSKQGWLPFIFFFFFFIDVLYLSIDRERKRERRREREEKLADRPFTDEDGQRAKE